MAFFLSASLTFPGILSLCWFSIIYTPHDLGFHYIWTSGSYRFSNNFYWTPDLQMNWPFHQELPQHDQSWSHHSAIQICSSYFRNLVFISWPLVPPFPTLDKLVTMPCWLLFPSTSRVDLLAFLPVYCYLNSSFVCLASVVSFIIIMTGASPTAHSPPSTLPLSGVTFSENPQFLLNSQL